MADRTKNATIDAMGIASDTVEILNDESVLNLLSTIAGQIDTARAQGDEALSASITEVDERLKALIEEVAQNNDKLGAGERTEVMALLADMITDPEFSVIESLYVEANDGSRYDLFEVVRELMEGRLELKRRTYERDADGYPTSCLFEFANGSSSTFAFDPPSHSEDGTETLCLAKGNLKGFESEFDFIIGHSDRPVWGGHSVRQSKVKTESNPQYIMTFKAYGGDQVVENGGTVGQDPAPEEGGGAPL